MKYTIVWKPNAERQLAQIWNNATDRNSVTDAANAIEKLLQTDPDEQGESRWATIRILLVEPLGVFFEVRPDDRMVVIGDVWHVV